MLGQNMSFDRQIDRTKGFVVGNSARTCTRTNPFLAAQKDNVNSSFKGRTVRPNLMYFSESARFFDPGHSFLEKKRKAFRLQNPLAERDTTCNFIYKICRQPLREEINLSEFFSIARSRLPSYEKCPGT